ncbi:hypothetical protein RKD47_005552 [Streptomyces albogriseolus]
MWPGQQPPGGEQNPQSNNPYQQPGYQQPNPYQQPGYQQPNPYQQQPQWGEPSTVGMPQPGDGGGGGNRTKLVAIIAATAVVVAAGVTGFLVLGGDKDDEADGKKPAKPSATASKDASADPAPSASGGNPRGGEGEKATIPGWQVVVNTRFGTKFDVPADWEIETPDTSVGFEWEEKNGEMGRTTVTAPAYLKSKWCTADENKDGRTEDTALATAGTRGENGREGHQGGGRDPRAVVDLRRLHAARQEEREVRRAEAVHHEVRDHRACGHGAFGGHAAEGQVRQRGQGDHVRVQERRGRLHHLEPVRRGGREGRDPRGDRAEDPQHGPADRGSADGVVTVRARA